jgi:hypothetical protein
MLVAGLGLLEGEGAGAGGGGGGEYTLVEDCDNTVLPTTCVPVVLDIFLVSSMISITSIFAFLTEIILS